MNDKTKTMKLDLQLFAEVTKATTTSYTGNKQ